MKEANGICEMAAEELTLLNLVAYFAAGEFLFLPVHHWQCVRGTTDFLDAHVLQHASKQMVRRTLIKFIKSMIVSN